MVKLTKKAIKAVKKDRTYQEESLINLLCKTEAMLNSRPLLLCSNDPSDFDVLIPNNFIIKSSTTLHQVILTKMILVQGKN